MNQKNKLEFDELDELDAGVGKKSGKANRHLSINDDQAGDGEGNEIGGTLNDTVQAEEIKSPLGNPHPLGKELLQPTKDFNASRADPGIGSLSSVLIRKDNLNSTEFS